MKDIMVDIETMANGSNAAIVQIAALQFDRNTGKISSHEFKINVDLQSCLDTGLHVNGDTVKFWMTKTDAQRRNLYEPKPEHIMKALSDFSNWMERRAKDADMSKADMDIWSRSPRFDLGILKDAYNKCNLNQPWNFRNEMCVRTIEAFMPDVKKKHDLINSSNENSNSMLDYMHQLITEGLMPNHLVNNLTLSNHHDALSDCVHQIAYVSEIWRKTNEAIDSFM
jgi:hypothetical protein